MDLQNYLLEGLKQMFIGKTVKIETERITDSVCIQDVEIDGDLIVLKTNKESTCEIKMSLSIHEFCFLTETKYSVTFMPEKGAWTTHACNGSLEIL